MLIVSKFHDFYDHVQKTGIDKHVVLQRKQEYVDVPSALKQRRVRLGAIATKRSNAKFNSFLEGTVYELDWLYFCGKAYPCIISYFEKDKTKSDFKKVTLQELESKLPATSSYYKKHWISGVSGQQILHNALKSNNDVSTEIFRNLGVPYFSIVDVEEILGKRKIKREVPKVLLYPKLSDYTTHLNMDAYTVYQEIEMYCSGVLGVGEPETIEVSDISKRDSKGFDKYSFKHRK